MIPCKNNIWWYEGHRRMIPSVPYDYTIPPVDFLQGIEKPIQKQQIIINQVPVSKPKKAKPAPKIQNELF